MRAAVYLRISKDALGEALGVERQREDCLRYVSAKKGWNVVEIFTDNDISATQTAKPRPQFERMLKAVQAKEVDVIVAYHLDRLLRRLSELEKLLLACQEAGVQIVTVADSVDTSNDGGRLVARILASVAQGEVERKSSRIRRALRQRAENGIGWGSRAFGYKEDDSGLVAREAKAIREAYSAILAGHSLYSIGNKWNERGFRTGKGNPWVGATVKAVLLNPRNAGLRSYNGEIIAKAQWPAIVDRDTWEAVHAVLTAPGRGKAFNKVSKYLLSGFVRCGVCGNTLAVGGSDQYRAYMCKHYGCYKVSRRISIIDRAVRDIIVARLSMPDAVEVFVRPQPDMRGLYEELRSRRQKLEQIALDYADDVLTSEQARVAKNKVEARVEEIERTIALAATDTAFIDMDESDPGAWFDALPLDRQKALVRLLCDVYIDPVGRGNGNRHIASGVRIEWRVND